MRKVLLIGPGGAGKSTLATRLGERLGLPVFHLDALYWRPGWKEPTRGEWRATLAPLLAQEAWIMDGNFGGTLDQRLAAADTAILLDLPPLLCAWRVLRRRWRYRGRHRPDMHPGCPEKLDLDFLWWVLTYRVRKRPAVLAKLRAWAADAPGHRVMALRSDREVSEFLDGLQKSQASNSSFIP